jgi:hypothetical protein
MSRGTREGGRGDLRTADAEVGNQLHVTAWYSAWMGHVRGQSDGDDEERRRQLDF